MLVHMYVLHFVSVYADLSAVTVNAMKNNAIVVQWDAVDGAINYIVRWTNESNHTQSVATSWTSVTINGLTLDTVYTITVYAFNRCGHGPDFITSVHVSLSTACTISPTVTVSTTPMTILSTANPSTTTIAFISSSTTTTTITTTTVTSTVVESSVIIPSAITYPSTTNIVDSPISTTKPANTPTVDETSKFSNISNIISTYIYVRSYVAVRILTKIEAMG